jgi:hypothetical protein
LLHGDTAPRYLLPHHLIVGKHLLDGPNRLAASQLRLLRARGIRDCTRSWRTRPSVRKSGRACGEQARRDHEPGEWRRELIMLYLDGIAHSLDALGIAAHLVGRRGGRPRRCLETPRVRSASRRREPAAARQSRSPETPAAVIDPGRDHAGDTGECHEHRERIWSNDLQPSELFWQPGIILFTSFHAGAKTNPIIGIETAPIANPRAPDMAASTIHSSTPAADGRT